MNAPTPKATLFENPDLRVRMNPDTYIKFDGSEHVMIQNVYCDQAVRIKYDIMLILYELVAGQRIADLLAPWPKEDQQKIIQYLGMFHDAQIILCDDEQTPQPVAKLGEGAAKELPKSKVHINVENHLNMLKDYVRLAAYRRAIEHVVNAETIAMDLGAGTGILSFFAAQAGAKLVYAIEKQPHIVALAQELAAENGFDQHIDFIEGLSNLVPADRLQPKPTVLIAEIIGDGILEENILEYTLDARDRLLAPGGTLIPYQLDIYVFPFQSDVRESRLPEVHELKDLYGVDFSLMASVLSNKASLKLEHYTPMLNKTMGEAVLATTLDLRTLTSSMFHETFEVPIAQNGEVTGFCGYFKVHLDESTTLTNSPWAPKTHWRNLVYTLPAARSVTAGESLNLELRYDGSLRLQLL